MDLKLTFLISLTLTKSRQAKVLLTPGFATSHCLEMMSVGEELLKRGHHVTIYSMLMDPEHCLDKFNIEPYKDRFTIHEINDDKGRLKSLDGVMEEMSKASFARESLFSVFRRLLYPSIITTCDLAFTDQALLSKLKEEKHDIALLEGIPLSGCFHGIPILLDIPSVAFGSLIDFHDSRTPLQTAVFPSPLTEYSNNMNFVQRVMNTLLSLVFPIMRNLMMPSIDLSQYDKKLTGLDTNNLMKESVLFIENSDFIVDYPKAIYPNFIQAGALTAFPAKPLPADLKKILDDAKEGVILCTFGTVLKTMPKELKQKFMDAFNRLNHPVLFKQDKDDVQGNVRIMKWLPQNDILGHLNTKLFISHCGKNGFWESVYHGVPIICMSIHAETYTTKVKVKKYGIGSAINIFDDTVDELLKTINDVLGNESIARNMKLKSTLLKDRPETPRQRAASGIEHVLKYGGDHMRPPSVHNITYTGLDVWGFLFVVAFLLLALDYWIISRCCCRNKAAKTKTD